MRILEAKDLEIYKRLLRILGAYAKEAPAQGIERLLNSVVEQGKKALPKDKHALNILDEVLDEENPADTVQKLMNMRFANLPICCKPVAKLGRRCQCAYWNRGDYTSDRVKDLIDWSGTGKSGKWSEVDGSPVKLVDMSKEEK